ncbi:MAG TPA: hypothetical protein VGR86_14395 [Steroidobacteraceae bacterium]|nr:hypothetical protein [Steroidobacteraceae bacterium]
MDASPLAGWDNFYVIIGSSAGGLTGLTFVVIALIRDSGQGVRPTGLGAFVTPMIVHFCGALALAAFMSMPHQRAGTLSAGLALGGLAGIVYGGCIGANMRRTGTGAAPYIPVREDWIWNVILPTAVYAGLAAMAILIWDRLTEAALYGVAVLVLALLFIGIRNAWDLVVWISTHPPREKD